MTDLNIRQRLEEAEENLSPYAAKSRISRGRCRPEDPCPLRTAFQRDRDRIIHSNSFRRLKHKTQVFIAPLGDHYVTRLTHTLEVAQIARTISRCLNLNEDLTEAIALCHDLGHTPFGHIGEDILNELCPEGFKHNEQSLRVVDVLEKYGVGLNLTWEVRDGILNHSKGNIGILGSGWTDIGTLEGQVVKIADIVAYINHDIKDALRANVITENDLPKSVRSIIGNTSSERINTMVIDIVTWTLANMEKNGSGKPVVGMTPQILNLSNELRDLLFARVYNSDLATIDKDKAREVIYAIFSYFLNHPDKLPDEYGQRNDAIERKITDHVAGMTDHYAVRLAHNFTKKRYVFTKLL